MKKYAKKIFSLIIAIAFLLSLLSLYTSAVTTDSFPSTSKADAVCLYNINTDTVLHSKNMQKKIFPGSAVKMMTGLIACEELSARLDESVTITQDMLTDSSGANIKLSDGMTVTLENLLYGVLCGGGNDAALVLASLLGEDVESFVRLMNVKAREWGLTSTKFTNPTGLDDSSMYSTLSDILTLARRAHHNRLYMDISSTVSYAFTPIGSDEEIKVHNRNSLVSTHYSNKYKNAYASGMIAGSTDLGGNCVITLAERKSTQYICIVMGAESDDKEIYSYHIANSLLDHAFKNYSYKKILDKGTVICEAEIRFAMPSSKEETIKIPCIVRDDVHALIPNTIDENKLTYRYYLHNEPLNAPIDRGTIVGGVDIICDGEAIGNAVLVAEGDVYASEVLLFLDDLKNFFVGRAFWLSVVVFVILFFIYYYISELKFRHKNASKIKYKNFY